jgi:hypothetical protein
MNEADYLRIVNFIDETHRKLARLALDQNIGAAQGKTFLDIVSPDSILLREAVISDLRAMAASESDAERKDMIERVSIACMDLSIEAETSSLADMFRFYMEKGRMVVQGKKIPALEIVQWLQNQDSFELREEMRKEIGIFSRAILNPILLSILDILTRTVKEKFGFRDYADYVENKRNSSFEDWRNEFMKFLSDTDDPYFNKAQPWVEGRLGRPLEDLNRCHALRLLRIDDFDKYFAKNSLMEFVHKTFIGLGLDLAGQKDIMIDIDDSPEKTPNVICIPVDLPGEIHVMLKPVGGLVDLEALLHEMGHAFFLRGFSAKSPIEHRRLCRSSALDETFAFLFMQLIENPVWLRKIAKLDTSEADELSAIVGIKRLLLIRRHVGKFLAEMELFQNGVFKDSSGYCKWLNRATGFNYEPDGYLIDMDPDFYSAEYVWAWAGADLVQQHLYDEFGTDWFRKPQAGDFLRQISLEGRKNSLEDALSKFCATTLRMPKFG